MLSCFSHFYLIVFRESVACMKAGEEEKTKHYLALCRSESPLTEENLSQLNTTEPFILKQTTPIRVLHRRNLSVRDRTVYTMSAEHVNPHMFKLSIATQAGTYIKEFVHGDFNRTTPNLQSMLGCDVDILALDVMVSFNQGTIIELT